MFVTPLLPL
jgi:hypothetical protein